MNRDPFYQKILKRLGSALDPLIFEDCAADILRSTWPTLVPIHGGSDSGMDGAVADGEGEPFPLVTTTSKDAIGNLTRNLNKYVKDGGRRRKVIFAASGDLTPRKKENLYRRARKLGFILLQVHDQRDFANRLYHSPKWCKELLGLTGDPVPLSKIPPSERIFLDLPLVGREADLTWFRQADGDIVLVGQPGAGKTYLARRLAVEGEALFVNTDDRDEIAEGIREQRPTLLMVDDSQRRAEVLLNLKQLREETGAEFHILGICWPSYEGDLSHILNVPSSQIHRLELLRRGQIVQVIKEAGIAGPTMLVRELTNQAEGRPGLAVTLAHLCLQGDVQQVIRGEALAKSLLKNLGEDAIVILAAFAIGGESGMELAMIADELKIPPLQVRDALARLDAIGIIVDVSDKQVAIRPPALREVLVREVFFGGARSIRCEGLIWRAPSLEQVGFTLIGASSRGAKIPSGLIHQILNQAKSVSIWRDYASLGRAEALWVLIHNPQLLAVISRPLLLRAPDVSIPLLLDKAIGDNRALHASPDHPVRLIEDWVKSALRGSAEPIRRRKILLDTACAWLAGGKDTGVGLQALAFAFLPYFEQNEMDPGEGRVFTIRTGPLTLQELHAVQDQWPQAVTILQQIQIDDSAPLSLLMEEYVYPGRQGYSISPEIATVMEGSARRMLSDIAGLYKSRQDIAYWAKPMALGLNMELEFDTDHEFEILHPHRSHGDWQKEQEEQTHRISALATEWKEHDPQAASQKLAALEQMAERAKASWHPWPAVLCEQIAAQVSSPLQWAMAFMAAPAGSRFVFPFLKRAAALDEPDWIQATEQCLENPNLRDAAILVVLGLPEPPQQLLDQILDFLAQMADTIEFKIARKEIPEGTVRRLLLHSDPEVARAAAKGEWMSDPQGVIRNSLQQEWRAAVLLSPDDGYWLRQVLIADPELARAWLEKHITERSFAVDEPCSAMVGALAVIDDETRTTLLDQIPDTYDRAQLIFDVVDDRLQVYRTLLENPKLKEFHLVPLGGEMVGNWVERAKVALDHGYSVEQVVSAAQGFTGVRFWSGDESNMWMEWMERFRKLRDDPDERIRRVGEIGHAFAEEQQQQALTRERNEAIYGSD